MRALSRTETIGKLMPGRSTAVRRQKALAMMARWPRSADP